VPLVWQIEHFYCVPACLKMVLEYLNNSGMLTTPAPNLSLYDIAGILKTEDGTWAHNVPLINAELEVAIPSVEFEDEYKPHTPKEIEQELEGGRPCVAIIDLTDGIHHVWHAVVVTHIDIDANQIVYNDPAIPVERIQPLSAFSALWNRALTTLLKVQIGRNTRTVITQFAGDSKA
jgi:hypothetical protein